MIVLKHGKFSKTVVRKNVTLSPPWMGKDANFFKG